MNSQRNRINTNGVNGIVPSQVNFSPGRNRHVMPQVATGHHSATVSMSISNRQKRRISTWNVRTLFQKGKLDNVLKEMDRLQIDIMGMSEVRWPGAGSIEKNGARMIYSGGEKAERGVGIILSRRVKRSLVSHWCVSDRILLIKLRAHPFNINVIQVYGPTLNSAEEEKDKFYDLLDKTKAQCKPSEVTIVMGDFNAKIGKGRVENVIGPFGLGDRNESGDRLAEWCISNRQVVTNTWFRNHPRRLHTWISPGDQVRNQIDFITISQRFRNMVTNCHTYPGADCGSDHNPVVATLRLKLKKVQ